MSKGKKFKNKLKGVIIGGGIAGGIGTILENQDISKNENINLELEKEKIQHPENEKLVKPKKMKKQENLNVSINSISIESVKSQLSIFINNIESI